jgi:hypothetical protein
VKSDGSEPEKPAPPVEEVRGTYAGKFDED